MTVEAKENRIEAQGTVTMERIAAAGVEPGNRSHRPALPMGVGCRAALVGLALLISLSGASHAATGHDEAFRYHWTLKGFLSLFARAFVPGQGEGVLSNHLDELGHLRTELLVTSRRKAGEDFWRYGSETEVRSGRLLRAWTSYRHRGKSKQKESEIDAEGAVEITSLIYRICKTPPSRESVLQMWWDGKIYPTRIVPRGLETLSAPTGTIQAHLFEILGEPPEGKRLKGHFRLWVDVDENRPLEFSVSRRTLKVRFRLRPAADDALAASTHPSSPGR